MRIVVFGLTISSSFCNGHASAWRALVGALGRLGHHTTFFEKEVPYYARYRDLEHIEGGDLHLYESWASALPEATRAVAAADVAMVTSFCPDGVAAAELVLDSRAPRKVFYDLDAPVTLALARAGQRPSYIGPGGLGRFDLVLSSTGGAALRELVTILGAPRVAALHPAADPAAHHPVPAREALRADLSFLGTFAADRVESLSSLFVEAARARPQSRFSLGGALYPPSYPWPANVARHGHVPPGDQSAFYCSSRVTLRLTRRSAGVLGYCPGARLFEAAASGAAIVCDAFEGLDRFFTPGREILVAERVADVLAALDRDDAELARMGRAARERALGEHTAEHRAHELIRLVEGG